MCRSGLTTNVQHTPVIWRKCKKTVTIKGVNTTKWFTTSSRSSRLSLWRTKNPTRRSQQIFWVLNQNYFSVFCQIFKNIVITTTLKYHDIIFRPYCQPQIKKSFLWTWIHCSNSRTQVIYQNKTLNIPFNWAEPIIQSNDLTVSSGRFLP